jgi:hypothetical protein
MLYLHRLSHGNGFQHLSSSASVFTALLVGNWLKLTLCSNWQTPRLAAISHQPPTLLAAVSRLSRNRSCSSLYSLGTDRIENASPNSSSIAASLTYRMDRVENTSFQLLHYCLLWICCLATGVIQLLIWRWLPTNWPTCHNIIRILKQRSWQLYCLCVTGLWI